MRPVLGDGEAVLMVTAAVSTSEPPLWVAVTRNVPAVLPAVKSPFDVMVPPVAENVAMIGTVEPSLIWP